MPISSGEVELEVEVGVEVGVGVGKGAEIEMLGWFMHGSAERSSVWIFMFLCN